MAGSNVAAVRTPARSVDSSAAQNDGHCSLLARARIREGMEPAGLRAQTPGLKRNLHVDCALLLVHLLDRLLPLRRRRRRLRRAGQAAVL